MTCREESPRPPSQSPEIPSCPPDSGQGKLPEGGHVLGCLVSSLVLLIRKLIKEDRGSAQGHTVSDRAGIQTQSPDLFSTGFSTASGLMEEAQACPQGVPSLLDHEHILCPKGCPVQPSLPHTPLEIRGYTHTRRPWSVYRTSSLYYCGPGFLFPINGPATPPPRALPHLPRAGRAASSTGLLSPSPILTTAPVMLPSSPGWVPGSPPRTRSLCRQEPFDLFCIPLCLATVPDT